MNDQKSFAQAVRLYTVGDKLFREVGDNMREMLHDINESQGSGNMTGVACICWWLGGRFLSSGDFAVAGRIKYETAHGCIEGMDEAELKLPRSCVPFYRIITLLLSQMS